MAACIAAYHEQHEHLFRQRFFHGCRLPSGTEHGGEGLALDAEVHERGGTCGALSALHRVHQPAAVVGEGAEGGVELALPGAAARALSPAGPRSTGANPEALPAPV